MVKKRVIVLIVIWELFGVFCHYIPEKPNEIKVYEVKEDKLKHSLTITNPKTEKPTLREIIYYHIIETPYGENQEINGHITKHDNAIDNDSAKVDDSIENEHAISNKEYLTDAGHLANEHDNDRNRAKGNGIDMENELNVSDNENISDGGNVVRNEKEFDSERVNQDKEVDSEDIDRYFTNGHGFQFNSNPENQDNSSVPKARIDDEVNVSEKNIESTDPDVNELSPEVLGNATLFFDDEDSNVRDKHSNKVNNDTNDLGNKRRKRDVEYKITGRKEKEQMSLLEKALSVVQRNKRGLKNEGKTYGMSLAGGRGVVWNDLNDLQVAYYTGDEIREKKEVKKKTTKKHSGDDKEINTKINKFKKELGNKNLEEPKTVKSKSKKASVEILNTEAPIIEVPSTKKPSNVISSTKKPSIKVLKPKKPSIRVSRPKKPNIKVSTPKKPSIAVKSTKKPRKVIASTQKPIVEVTKNAEPNKMEPNTKKLTKTYGMSLTGDHGMVWNDLNDHRVAYRVGENEENGNEDDSVYKKNKQDQEIDAKIEKFEKELAKPVDETEIKKLAPNKPSAGIHSTEKSTTEKPITEEPITNKPILEKPIIKEPITNKPSTEKIINSDQNKPVKTYGMSLNGDHGLVWNDLNDRPVSYHVGEETEENKDDTNAHLVHETTEKPDFNAILNNTVKPTDGNKDDDSTQHVPWNTDDAYKEIDKIFGTPEENTNPDNNTNNAILNELVDIIKEVFQNETAKLDEKINCNNPDRNDNGKDENRKEGNKVNAINGNENNNSEGADDKTSIFPEDTEKVIKNEQFWKWLNEWIIAYTELLMNRIDTRIKTEVTKQIEEYFANHEHTTETATTNNENYYGIDPKKELENAHETDGSSTKKRKDKDTENKKEEKESPVKIEAQNVYGSSVGNGNVTNIFVFNIRNISDIESIKKLSNGSNGIYVFGNNEKPIADNTVSSEENKDNTEGQTTQNPNGFLSTNALSETEKPTTKPVENTHDGTPKLPTESESTTKQPKIEETTEQNANDKVNGQKDGNEKYTTEHPSDSSNKNPKDTIESSFLNDESNKKTNDATTEPSKDKDTTTDKLTTKPNSEGHKPDKTTEVPKEESLLPEKENEDAKENDKTENKVNENAQTDATESKSEDTESVNSKETDDKEKNKPSESKDKDTDKNSVVEANSAEEVKVDTAEKKNEKEIHKEETDHHADKLEDVKTSEEQLDTNDKGSEESDTNDKESEESDSNDKESEKLDTNDKESEESDSNEKESEKLDTNDKESEKLDTNDKESEELDTNDKESKELDTDDKESEKLDTNNKESEESDTNNRESEKLDTNDKESEESDTNDKESEKSNTNDKESKDSTEETNKDVTDISSAEDADGDNDNETTEEK